MILIAHYTELIILQVSIIIISIVTCEDEYIDYGMWYNICFYFNLFIYIYIFKLYYLNCLVYLTEK